VQFPYNLGLCSLRHIPDEKVRWGFSFAKNTFSCFNIYDLIPRRGFSFKTMEIRNIATQHQILALLEKVKQILVLQMV
jgi:hypothetical protein